MLAADVLGEFEDAVGFASETTDRCGVVEGVTCDGEAVDAPERRFAALLRRGSRLRADDGLPGEGIDAIDDDPYAYDGDEPVAGMADVLPEFNETDVEGEEHHDHGGKAEEEEEVVEALLAHFLFTVYGLQFTDDLLAKPCVSLQMICWQSHGYR